jgi:tetratricopeptide (TPR) repeat protein
MPTVYNGVGTWYYGKRNFYQRPGTCPYCHKDVILSSYDTSKFFVFLFVPIIPLGKKRIIDCCPSCRKLRLMPLKQWQMEKDKELSESKGNYEKQPKDPSAARELIERLVAFQQEQEFQEIADGVRQNFSNNAEVLNLLADAYNYFGKYEEAEQLYKDSLLVEHNVGVAEALAFCLIKQNKPEEATKHLLHIIKDRVAEKASYLILLAEGFQAVGNHFEALDILDRAADIEPKLKKDKDFKKTRKVSQKYQHTNKPITKKSTLFSGKQSVSKHAFSAWHVWLVASIIVLILLGIYLFTARMEGKNREVYFVSGLSRPYQIRVNGISRTLEPLGWFRMNTGEGEIVVEVEDELIGNMQQKYMIKTPILLRPFLDRIFLINPDSLALVYWQKIFYITEGRDAPDDEDEIYMGQTSYSFDDIDYVFQPFPPKITLVNVQKEAKKRVSLLSDVVSDPWEIATVVSGIYSEGETVEFIKKHLLYEPLLEQYLYSFYSMVDPNEFIEVIEPSLKARPIRINWHRMYQEAKEKTNSDYDLVSEYRKFLAEDPEDSALQYLLGRIVRDNSESIELFSKSVSGDDPCPYGYYALAYQRLSIAEFDEALEFARQAVSIGSEELNFRGNLRSALLATGRYDELIGLIKEERKNAPTLFTWVQEEIDVLLIKGEDKKAQEILEDWLATVAVTMDEDMKNILRKNMRARAAYLMGDLREHAALTEKLEDPNEKLYADISCGRDIDEQLINELNIQDPYIYLFLYMATKQSGETELADKYLSKGVKLLSKLGREERYLSECLEGKQTAVPEKICSMSFEYRSKAIILTVLGVRYPEQREPYFQLAEKLNFDKRFPYLLLKSILEENSQE